MPIRLARLRIYPVKGLRGFDVEEAVLELHGIQHDRRWAILGPDGVVLTQRDLPGMAGIDAFPEGDGLRLERAGFGSVTARSTGESIEAVVWRRAVPVVGMEPDASAWLSRVLGISCQLVFQADPAGRPLKPEFAKTGDCVSLADGFPLLVVTAGSLQALNAELEVPVPIERFRPNLILDGAEPWAEDEWGGLAFPGAQLRLASACARCKVITLDQTSGDTPVRMEPLRTLGRIRRGVDGAITFGWNAIPDGAGLLRRGEQASVVGA